MKQHDAAPSVAIVESDEATLDCVKRALEGSPFRVALECASTLELAERLSAEEDLAAILIGSDGDAMASEAEIRHLRQRYGEPEIVAVAFRAACRRIKAGGGAETSGESAALVKALEWALDRRGPGTAGKGPAASGAVRPHVKSLVRRLPPSR